MRLEIACCDRLGIAQDILGIFVTRQIDLRGIELQTSGKIFINIPDFPIEMRAELISDIGNIEGVLSTKLTPYMPSELEHIELSTLIKTLPDPFISLDKSGCIRSLNTVAAELLHRNEKSVIGRNIEGLFQGLNFSEFFSAPNVEACNYKLYCQNAEYLADVLPIHLPDPAGNPILAGAILLLKSEKRLDQQLHAFKNSQSQSFSSFTANSGAMNKVIKEAKRLALLNESLLIFGETGTGKELLARACHAGSERADKAFMTLSCATLPDDVAETELFGSGGVTSKRGLFELADGGTLFLDEVGEMSPKLQTKLLRVIENGCFRRVDNEDEVNVNVRIISSTKCDLLELVASGKFREDLYYRLNVLGINIPALRERRSDIIPLAEFFMTKFALRSGNNNIHLSGDCRDFIEHYPWPGNVRQLENVLNRVVSLVEDDTIESHHLALPHYTKKQGYLDGEFSGTLEEAVKGFEAEILTKLYPAYPSSRQLAKKLSLSHTAVANKLREYKIKK